MWCCTIYRSWSGGGQVQVSVQCIQERNLCRAVTTGLKLNGASSSWAFGQFCFKTWGLCTFTKSTFKMVVSSFKSILAATLATNARNLPSSEITFKILHLIKLSLIPKSIGVRKQHHNSFIVRARSRPQL